MHFRVFFGLFVVSSFDRFDTSMGRMVAFSDFIDFAFFFGLSVRVAWILILVGLLVCRERAQLLEYCSFKLFVSSGVHMRFRIVPLVCLHCYGSYVQFHSSIVRWRFVFFLLSLTLRPF